jgi:dTDP-4-dehydrorhamnose 3,5-epimerase
MQIFGTALPEVKIVVPKRVGDARGVFSEVWNTRDFAAAGIAADFVQDKHIRNPLKGTFRGLHYQLAPATLSDRDRKHPRPVEQPDLFEYGS